MIRYLGQRLLAMVPTLFGITLLTFVVISIAPGDPVSAQFETGAAGAGGAEGGGGQDQDRLADTIKAKKQLLGMMAKDFAVLSWEAGAPGGGTDAERVWPDRTAQLDSWARKLARVGDTVYVGTADGEIVVLNRQGAEQRRFAAHDNAIWGLAAAEDGTVASADKTGRITLHGPDGTEVARREGDGRPVRSLVFVDDRLAAASDSGVVWLLDRATANVERELKAHTGGVYAIAALPGGRLVSGGADRRLITWDLASGALLSDDEDSHGGSIADLEVSPDGAWLASGSGDRQARVFGVSAGGLAAPRVIDAHYKEVSAVTFSDDGRVLHTGSRDETVASWETASGRPLGRAAESTGRVLDLVAVGDTALAAGEFWRKVSILTRYVNWVGRLVTFDFGRSFVDDEPVIDKLAKAVPITIGLNLLAIFIVYLVSVPIGIYAALKRGQTFDNASSLVLFVLYSIPNFWLATLLIMFFSSARALDLFPSGGLHTGDPWAMSFWPWVGDLAWHLVLPVIVLVYAGFASLSRYVRTSMLEALSQDFVRTARAKGLKERVVVVRHAFGNALITIVTLIGNLLPRLFGGSVIVEYIFSIEGMGKLSFDAILSRDYPVIMAVTTIAAVLTLLGILISDLLYGVVDPRVRVNE
ncbi:MAG: ABC transporter permease subunit [Myxococcota bacterium]